MAGETVKGEAVCLAVRPWSQTSHIVSWLTDEGRLVTSVKGAERAKSAFLGQYDLNYTCEIVWYARGKGDVHALRECAPLVRRDALRGDYRALALADYYRYLAGELAPSGPEARAWRALLTEALDALEARATAGKTDAATYLRELLAYELRVLDLAGLAPGCIVRDGAVTLRGEREMSVGEDVAACLRNPRAADDPKILVDTARVIGVFYSFHLDCAPDVRRTVLRMISDTKKTKENE